MWRVVINLPRALVALVEWPRLCLLAFSAFRHLLHLECAYF
jgi:hypothetical protein